MGLVAGRSMRVVKWRAMIGFMTSAVMEVSFFSVKCEM